MEEALHHIPIDPRTQNLNPNQEKPFGLCSECDILRGLASIRKEYLNKTGWIKMKKATFRKQM
jgi:hypothetical protein